MAVKIYESENDIPVLVQAEKSGASKVCREVTVSRVTRSLAYMRIAYVICLVVYLVGTSSFPKGVVDWLEDLGYVQKTQAVVVGRDNVLHKVYFLQVQYRDSNKQLYVDGILDLKKHMRLYNGMSEDKRTITVYYYTSLPETVYAYGLDWMFYFFWTVVTSTFLGLTWYIEKRGMTASLPLTSFSQVREIRPVTLVGILGQVYGEPALKNIPYMHYTTIWKADNSDALYVGKPYIVGNGLTAGRLSRQTEVAYRELKFLDRPNCGIMIKHKDTFEIVHPESTPAANTFIFNDRKLLKLVHQGSLNKEQV